MFETNTDVLTVEEVCKALSLGKNSVYRLLQQKQLNNQQLNFKKNIYL